MVDVLVQYLAESLRVTEEDEVDVFGRAGTAPDPQLIATPPFGRESGLDGRGRSSVPSRTITPRSTDGHRTQLEARQLGVVGDEPFEVGFPGRCLGGSVVRPFLREYLFAHRQALHRAGATPNMQGHGSAPPGGGGA